MGNETPRGILFVLDAKTEDEKRASLESLRFDREIFELQARGRCVVVPRKWIN